MKVAVIVDSDEKIYKWQYQALTNLVQRDHEISLLLVAKRYEGDLKKKFTNLFYYIYAFIARYKLELLTRIPIQNLMSGPIKKIDFTPIKKGIWESLPFSVLGELSNYDVVIKFGMGLLAETEKIPAKYGILSYHHGDPNNYRGRPAGFWEIVNSETVMGIMVQQLSNTLDAGQVKAMGHARVERISYRKTLKNMYSAGIPLLLKALENCENAQVIQYEKSKQLYRLPKNMVVMKLVLSQVVVVFKRLKYGAFYHKKWSTGETTPPNTYSGTIQLKLNEILELPTPKGFTFVADPSGVLGESLYCELLESKTGVGQIGIWNGSSWTVMDTGIKGHKSYPQIIQCQARTFLFPEVSGSSSPTLLELSPDGQSVVASYPLRNLEESRHVDATLHYDGKNWYLFSGTTENSFQALNLFIADDLFGEFKLHPSSPIALDPRNARMAGPLISENAKLFRFAQDCSANYGSRITVNEITELTPFDFSEIRVGTIEIDKVFGPHTFLRVGDKVWLDYYVESFDLMAGYRRAVGKVTNFLRK